MKRDGEDDEQKKKDEEIERIRQLLILDDFSHDHHDRKVI